MNFLNYFKRTQKSSNKIFWCDCNCNCTESYSTFNYNSKVCSNCIGIKDKTKQNFGDMITAYIFQKITGKHPIRTEDKISTNLVYFGSGSMMNLCIGWKNIVVWGTGIIHSKDTFEKPTKVLAVRGPLTRKRFLELGYDCPEVYGDIGLLLPRFYNKSSIKKFDIGIVPHYVDFEFCKRLFSSLSNVLIIDVCDDVENVIDQIRSCKKTMSSSLHGLIVSHAYGVESCWINLSNFVYGDDVKFFDYYHSQNILSVKSVSLEKLQSSLQDINNLITLVDQFPNPIFPIDTKKLMETCPFK